jgi:hypothetical protein
LKLREPSYFSLFTLVNAELSDEDLKGVEMLIRQFRIKEIPFQKQALLVLVHDQEFIQLPVIMERDSPLFIVILNEERV